MKIEKDVTIPAVPERTVKQFSHYECDFCHRQTTKDYYNPNWSDESFYSDTVKIQREFGSTYPEGNLITYENFHMCDQCWENKLVPWATSQGATKTITEIDT